ncbi:HK97 family phage prohead protease, partial [Rhizobium ruizarguesonis]
MGALTGLSIGFRTLEEEINRETGINHLKRVKLYEVSIVTFPANEAATISTVKSA